MKRIRTTKELESPVKKRVNARKPSPKRSIQSPASPPKATDLSASSPAKLKPIAPTESHVQTQKPPLKERGKYD